MFYCVDNSENTYAFEKRNFSGIHPTFLISTLTFFLRAFSRVPLRAASFIADTCNKRNECDRLGRKNDLWMTGNIIDTFFWTEKTARKNPRCFTVVTDDVWHLSKTFVSWILFDSCRRRPKQANLIHFFHFIVCYEFTKNINISLATIHFIPSWRSQWTTTQTQIIVVAVNGIWKVWCHWIHRESCRFYINYSISDRSSLRNLHETTSVNGNSNSQYEIARQILENDSSKCHKLVLWLASNRM